MIGGRTYIAAHPVRPFELIGYPTALPGRMVDRIATGYQAAGPGQGQES